MKGPPGNPYSGIAQPAYSRVSISYTMVSYTHMRISDTMGKHHKCVCRKEGVKCSSTCKTFHEIMRWVKKKLIHLSLYEIHRRQLDYFFAGLAVAVLIAITQVYVCLCASQWFVKRLLDKCLDKYYLRYVYINIITLHYDVSTLRWRNYVTLWHSYSTYLIPSCYIIMSFYCYDVILLC